MPRQRRPSTRLRTNLIIWRTPTFNQPANANDARYTTIRRRPRPYATYPDPTMTGELLLQAIKAGA